MFKEGGRSVVILALTRRLQLNPLDGYLLLIYYPFCVWQLQSLLWKTVVAKSYGKMLAKMLPASLSLSIYMLNGSIWALE